MQHRVKIQIGVVRPRVTQLHPQGKGILHGFHQVVTAQCIGTAEGRCKTCSPKAHALHGSYRVYYLVSQPGV